jgi:hypothetical protein
MHPLNTARRLVLMLPQNAEYELGFAHYMQKMMRLAKQAGARLQLYSTERTGEAVNELVRLTKTTMDITFHRFDNMEDFLVLARSISRDDLLVMVTARKGTLSYSAYMENLPARLARHFKDNNLLLIYPEQTELENIEPGVQALDLTLTPIQEQLTNLNKIGKAVKRIFKNPPKPEDQ